MPRASPTTYHHHLNVRHHTPLFFTRPYLARLPHNSDKNPQHKRENPPVFHCVQILSSYDKMSYWYHKTL